MPLMNKSNFETEIRESGRLVYTNSGDSMKPLIRQGKDVVVISPVNGKLKKYDVPLYRRKSGQYVLHRILKVRNSDYVVCGDNRWTTESGVTDEQIIGVLTSVIRNGKSEISVTDICYRIYVHLWCDFFYFRAFVLRLQNYIKRKMRKVLK